MAYTNSKGNSISPQSIGEMDLIGEGYFSKVYKGTWMTTDEYGDEYEETVAIKVAKRASKDQVLNERNRMANLSHENVVRLLGIIQRGGNNPPWLVMEYMKYGDLLSYIFENRSCGGIRAYGMMKIAWGIASGLEYLHGEGIIHGDVAARNCLIGSEDFDVKVGDLGYQDDKNADCYHNYGNSDEACAIRWMPPENLPYRRGRYGNLYPVHFKRSFAGDVWAFGIVLFEMWSRGETPFAGKADTQVCQLLFEKKKPTHFHDIKMRRHVWNLMHSCFQFNSAHRPGFSSIVHHFEKHLGITTDSENSCLNNCDNDSDSDYFSYH